MAETEAATGYGTWLKRGGVTATGFALVDIEITNIGGPGAARTTPQASHMTSPGRYHEYIAGMLDAGEIPVEYAFVPQDPDPILACVEAGKVFYQIGNDDWDVILQFQGIMSMSPPGIPLDDKMTGSATIKISGKPTLEAAA